MKFSISKRYFVEMVGAARGVADNRAPLLITRMVRLDAFGPSVGLAATDLTLAIQIRYRAEVEEAGAACVAAQDLFNVVRSLPRSARTVHLSTTVRRAHIECGGRVFHLDATATDEFPRLPDAGEARRHRVPVEELWSLLAATHCSMSKDETRPHLAAALVEVAGATLRVTTTDGHRLSQAERAVEGLDGSESLLVPARSLRKVKQMLGRAASSCGWSSGDLEVAAAGGFAFFRCGRLSISARLVEARFPSYEQVIPLRFDRAVTADREAILDAIRAAAVMGSADDAHATTRVVVSGGRMTVSKEATEASTASVSEDVPVSLQGPGLIFGFNGAYMMDALRAIEGRKVTVELGGEGDPFVVRSAGRTGYRCIIMPLRVRGGGPVCGPKPEE